MRLCENSYIIVKTILKAHTVACLLETIKFHTNKNFDISKRLLSFKFTQTLSDWPETGKVLRVMK